MKKNEHTNSQPESSRDDAQPFNIVLALSKYRRLLSVEEVAAILGRSACTVYRWARKGQIPSMMLAGSRMFDPSTLVLWLLKKEPQLLAAARHFEPKAA